MANTTIINVRTDAKVKDQAERIFEELGLNMSTAINVFLRQVIRKNGLPFEVALNIPNDETMAAIKEVEEMKKDNNKGYGTMEDLKKALDI